MSNTVIQIKYSNATSTPPSLNVGELAYSFTSDKLFVGNTTNAVLAIGGKYYVDLIDGATSANTPSTIVKRDALGGFTATHVYASLYGNANTATTLQTARTISFSGDVDAVSNTFNGSGDISFNLELTNTGVVAGTYGGATSVPYFVVDADGRITSAGNNNISTALSIAGDTGTDSVSLLTDTLTFEGGDGITSAVTNNKASFAVDNTVIRTTGGQTISGDIAITGNLVVSGNTITQDVENIRTEDALIELAANNASNSIDIGFFGTYVNGGTKYTTFMRDSTDGNFKILVDGTEKPNTANSVNVASFTRGTLDANLTGGTISGLSTDLAVADGGTGKSSFTGGAIIIGNGSGALAELANTGTAGTYGSASYIPVITTDAYGRVSGISNTQVSIDAARVTSGTLPIARGGTNQTSFTAGQAIVFNGTSLASRANLTQTITGGLATSNTITSLTFDPITGGITAYTAEKIAIDTSQIASGTLPVTRGGTGASTFAIKGVIVSDQSSTTGALSALTSSTEGHLLTINSSGAPVFAHLSGGTF